jgi:hypothetical protein
MPVSFLSTTQRERYGLYPESLTTDKLDRYFHLDLEQIAAALQVRCHAAIDGIQALPPKPRPKRCAVPKPSRKRLKRP